MTGVETGSLHEGIVLPLKIQVDLLTFDVFRRVQRKFKKLLGNFIFCVTKNRK